MNILHDIRYAARMLMKAPGFTLVAVITLALGIGANTAIFSVLEAVLLRELGYGNPNQLVVIWESNLKRNRHTNVAGPANYMRWKERNRSFESMAAFTELNATVTGAGEPEQVKVGFVSADIFDTLGVSARIGRTFGPEHAQPGASDVVVLSDHYWRARFGADPHVLGTKFSLNGTPVAVIGVMPQDFHGLMNVEFWNPIPFGEQHRNAGGRYLVVIGRLMPGVTRDVAQAEMNGIAKQCEQEMPDLNGGWGVNVVPLREQLVGQVRLALMIVFGAVGFVLLIACGNVANLMLARAMGRAREWAVRMALGASRGRLVGQLLTESLVLAIVGGAAGVLLGAWAVGGLRAVLPADLSRFTEVRLNPSVLAFTFGLTVLTGLVFGVAPALLATRGHLQDSMKEGSGGAGTSSMRMRLRGALVVGEIALSVVLLVGAGLLLKSFSRLNNLNAGFNPENVLSFRVSLSGNSYRKPSDIVQFYDRLLEGVRAMPGVHSAGAISWQLYGIGSVTTYSVPGQPPAPRGQEPSGEARMVTPGLLETLQIPLLRGRLFSERDREGAPRTVIVNENLAHQHWPNQDPIGQHIRMEWGEELDAEVVGVVGDVRLVALDQSARPTMYWPAAQVPNNFMTVMVRNDGDPAPLAGALKAVVAKIDPQIPVANIMKLEEAKAQSLNQRRFSMLLLGIFAGVAVALAAVGIYGVMAFAVSQRTHEIGVRMALGAQQSDVLKLVLRQGSVLAGIGLAIGLAAAFGLSRYLAALLFEVSERDPQVFTGVVVLLMLVALMACAVPARRAASVDPLVALRYE